MNFDSNFIKNFESLDAAQHSILSTILENGEESHPRGMRTLELFPVAFALLNPRRRCITTPRRRWSLPLALGEFCWHLSGSRQLEFIEYYAPSWKSFAEDELIQGSCYGHKIFNREWNVTSQWDRMVELLKSDPHSRRAVLLLSEPISESSAGARDVACASVLQFMIRAGQVHAFVHMRSNDAIWGLPYDVFLFTMLQELLASELGLELGKYWHFASSLHLYERHFELAKGIVKSPVTDFFEMPRMIEPAQVGDFLILEGQTRSGTSRDRTKMIVLNSYWRELLSVLEWYSSKRKTTERSERTMMKYDGTYSALLNNLLSKGQDRLSA